jgi:hypothetical protein
VRVEKGWKKLGEGMDGKLASCWVKTPYGIEASSGMYWSLVAVFKRTPFSFWVPVCDFDGIFLITRVSR